MNRWFLIAAWLFAALSFNPVTAEPVGGARSPSAAIDAVRQERREELARPPESRPRVAAGLERRYAPGRGPVSGARGAPPEQARDARTREVSRRLKAR